MLDASAKKVQSSFSLTGLVGYLIGGSGADRSPEDAEMLAQVAGRVEVAAFALPELLQETVSLPVSSLNALLSALLTASGVRLLTSPAGSSEGAPLEAMPTASASATLMLKRGNYEKAGPQFLILPARAP